MIRVLILLMLVLMTGCSSDHEKYCVENHEDIPCGFEKCMYIESAQHETNKKAFTEYMDCQVSRIRDSCEYTIGQG